MTINIATGRRIGLLSLAAITIGLIAVGLAACGSGGGGAAAPAPVVALATGTFTKAFAPVSALTDSYPFYTGDVKQQSLYLASEINGAGDIKTLRFDFNGPNAASATCPNTTIKLGHTKLTALTATFASNVETGQGSLVTVLSNATVSIPAGAGSTWFDIPLTTNFHYNGVDNLVVQIDHPTACSAQVHIGNINAGTNRRAVAFATDTTPGTVDYNATTANSADVVQPLMQFVFAGGDNLAYYGNVVGGNLAPFTTLKATYGHVQSLHPAASVNGSGPITGIGMVVGALTTGGTYTANIKLGHSTLTNLGTTFASNFNSGSPVTVAGGLTFTVPANVPAGSTLWLPFNGNFNYNGTDNLIVDIDVTAASGDTAWMYAQPGNSVRLYAASGATTGIADTAAYDTKFRFNGSTTDVMPGPAFSVVAQVLGNGGAGEVENLYEPVYLGTGGTINSIAVRLSSAPAAATLGNYKIYMGATAKTVFAMSDTWAGDMSGGGTLVYSGTIGVPGTLKAGDWLTIPLQTPFTYDPTQRLAIYFGTDQATAATANVMTHGSATQFPNQMMGGGTNGPLTGTPSWLANGSLDVRLGITK